MRKKVEEVILDEDNEVVLDEDNEVVLYEPSESASNPDFLMDSLFEGKGGDTPESSKPASSSFQTAAPVPADRPAAPVPADRPAAPVPADHPAEPVPADLGLQPVEAAQMPVAAQSPTGASSEGEEEGEDARLSPAPRSDTGAHGGSPGSRGSTRRLAYVWGFVTLVSMAMTITLLMVIYPDESRSYLSSVLNGQWRVGQSDRGGVLGLIGASHEAGPAPTDAPDSGKGSAAGGSDGTTGLRRGIADKVDERLPRQLAMGGVDAPRPGGEESSPVPRPEAQYVAPPPRGQDSSDATDSASGADRGRGPKPAGTESFSNAVADEQRRPPVPKPGDIESQPAPQAGKSDRDASGAPDSTGNTAGHDHDTDRGASADGSHSPIAEPLGQGGISSSEVPGRTGAVDSKGTPVRYEIALPTVMHSRASTLSPVVDILQPGEQADVIGHIAGTHWYRVMGKFGVYGFVYASLHAQPSAGPRARSGSDLHPRLVQLNEADTAIGEIPRMLQRAEGHFRADRLMTPKFKNALSLYREVLRLDPDNPQAQEGIRRIKAKLSRYAMEAENLGDVETARSLLMKILTIDPNDQEAKARLAGLEKTP